MTSKDFLFEIGCEELPSKLHDTAIALRDNIVQELKSAALIHKEIHYYATPRRMAVLVSELADRQPTQITERQGPSLEAAFDKDGTPTLACIGFARSCGVSTDELKIQESKKGSRVYCRIEQPGKSTKELLPDIIANAIKKLPLTKPMRWGNQEKAFLRPVHWIVMLYGNEVIDAEYFGQRTGQETRGHRFHHPKPIHISHPRDYEKLLQTNGMVVADFEKRKQKIRKQIENRGAEFGKTLVDQDLLNEVTALVEWPIALIGKFNAEYLSVPHESLITSMKVNQKYFPIVDQKDNLTNHFVLVSNIESKNPNTVVIGNERVINARLEDAAFFYGNDSKKPLNYFIDKLSSVVFQHSLGSLKDRYIRLQQLSAYIANALNLNKSKAERAAELAKMDLMSEMVGEFPELQGTMGYYYAKQAKEDLDVAVAIKEHYYPRFSGDRLPENLLGTTLALADRIDTLVGILGINKIPTGEKDPYALKRAALAVVRLLIEKSLSIDLKELLQQAKENYPIKLPNENVVEQTFQFIKERMRAWYLDQGVQSEIFAAVDASHPTKLMDFDQRIKAVQQFLKLPESSSLAAANKRVTNLLKQSEYKNSAEINQQLFELDIEWELAHLLQQKSAHVNLLYEQANYTQALSELATLKQPVDTFFDKVMIMVEDKKVRANRLALLAHLHRLFTQVADISLLP